MSFFSEIPGMRCRPIDKWPGELTRARIQSPFKASHQSTLFLLRDELRHIRSRNVLIMLAVRESDITVDGTRPTARARADHPGVMLSMETKHGPMKISCDRFTHWSDNLRAIALGLNDLRRLDRYGISKRGEQYRGWMALPAPEHAMETAVEAAVLLAGVVAVQGEDVDWLARMILAEPTSFKEAFRRAVKITHPDVNDGDSKEFHPVDQARQLLEAHHAQLAKV